MTQARPTTELLYRLEQAQEAAELSQDVNGAPCVLVRRVEWDELVAAICDVDVTLTRLQTLLAAR